MLAEEATEIPMPAPVEMELAAPNVPIVEATSLPEGEAQPLPIYAIEAVEAVQRLQVAQSGH